MKSATFLLIISFNLLTNSKVYFLDIEPNAVQYHLQEFKADAKRLGVRLYRIDPSFVIQEEDLYLVVDNERMQVEAYTDHVSQTIYFDSNSSMYNYNLKVLVYHELGHYYLRRDHTTIKSIMNFDIWDQSWDELSRGEQEYFIKELFRKL